MHVRNVANAPATAYHYCGLVCAALAAPACVGLSAAVRSGVGLHDTNDALLQACREPLYRAAPGTWHLAPTFSMSSIGL
jgi:hypothetical protein